jgi:hypothetical protein
MTDVKRHPTHRTRAGVEVIKVAIPLSERFYARFLGLEGQGVLFSREEFDALFEPIPKPATVTIPLDLARHLNDHSFTVSGCSCAFHRELRALIAEAERGEAKDAV